ncbi:MAG: hypothetical protein FWD56_03930 [Bacteroidales bacterium]|nr:hypothetical protein [Bacteroidales bacterium]
MNKTITFALTLMTVFAFAINTTDGYALEANAATQSIVFPSLPKTLAEFKALPQASMESPYLTAALFVVAFSLYPQNPNESIDMINFLKGPESLSPREINLIREQVRDKSYLPRSYFAGANPKNDYTPSLPYTVVVSDNAASFGSDNTARLFVRCGGADSPRPITLRKAKDGKWYLWDHVSLLVGIRIPESSNPWL